MQKLAVVFFPKINLEKINTFREKYDPNWHIIPPHITIVSPVSGISENQLEEHVDNVIKDLSYFSIRLTTLTKTIDDNLFLRVKKGNDEIVNLHDKLYSGILAPYVPTDFPFVPHVTLGDFRMSNNTLDKMLYAKAYREAQDLNLDMFCQFDAVSVIKGDGTTPAKIIKTIKLHS